MWAMQEKIADERAHYEIMANGKFQEIAKQVLDMFYICIYIYEYIIFIIIKKLNIGL